MKTFDALSRPVSQLHDRLLATPTWPADAALLPTEPLWHWVATNHRNNCLLWAEEDLARRTTVAAGARLNSETAGSMIDRMSIMALKINAMRQQT